LIENPKPSAPIYLSSCGHYERKKKLLRVVKTYKRKRTNQVKTLLNTEVIEEIGDTLRPTTIDG
jgi:hypothetical protein